MRLPANFRHAIETLQTSDALSAQASLFLLPASVYFAIVSYMLTGVAHWYVALVAGVAGWLAAGGALLAARTLLFADKQRRSAGVVIVSYIVSAVVRSVVVSASVAAWMGYALDFPFLFLRLLAAVPPFTLAGLAAAVISVSISNLRDRWRLAAAARDQRARLQIESHRRVRADIEDFSTLISERLLPLVDRIESQLGHDSSEARGLAKDVRSICEVEVREVSHQLASEPRPTRVVSRMPNRPTAWWAIRHSFEDTRFYAGWGYLAASIIVLPIGTLRAGWMGFGWLVVVLAASAVVGVALTKLPLPERYRRGGRATTLQLLWVLVVALFTQWLLSLTPYFDLAPQPQQSRFWSYGSISFLVWFVINLIGGSMRAAHQAITQTDQDNAALTAAVARLRKRHVQVRQQQARILHGPVQGRLSAVSMALTMHAQDPSAGWLDQAREQLQSARVALSHALGREAGEAESHASLAERLKALANEWRGLLDVMVTVDPDCEQAALEDAEVAEEIAEAVEECLLNSVRHGRARRAAVFVGCEFEAAGRVLSVEVTDDGNAPADTPIEPGLGGRVLEAAGAEREIIRTATGTRVRIEWRRA